MANHNDKPIVSLDQLTLESSQQLFENIAAWLQGNSITDIDLNGTPDQIFVIKEAMIATKKFHNELFNHNTNLKIVSECLELKHLAANRFQKTFGFKWVF